MSFSHNICIESKIIILDLTDREISNIFLYFSNILVWPGPFTPSFHSMSQA
jgi:hypothetical protein